MMSTARMTLRLLRYGLIFLTLTRTISAITAPIHWYVGIEAMAEELYGPLEDIFANPSPCTFRFPPGCDSSTCIFLGKWRSEQLSTGGIVVHFLIASLALGPNRWLGVGFSADRNMPHSDAIIAGMDTSGQRLYVSDRWISGYTSPVKDHVDNIINWEWKQESNMTIFYFVRRADTGDYDQDVDLFTDMQRCLFFHFPYSGGEYSEVTDTIGKHYVTPVTIGPICSDRCEDIPSDFELVHGYCAEDFIHPANPLAPVSIADCLTLCQRLSNCLSGAYNADNSRCLLRTSTCSLSRAVDVGRNWYTYNKKSSLMPSSLGGLGTGALPPWAVPLYPGGPTPLTLPPFPLFPQVPPSETDTEAGLFPPGIESSTIEPNIGDLGVTEPSVLVDNETGEIHLLNETESLIDKSDTNETIGDGSHETVTSSPTIILEITTRAGDSGSTPIDGSTMPIFIDIGVTSIDDIEVDQHQSTSEDLGQYVVQEVTEAPPAAPSVIEESSFRQPSEPASTGDFVADNYENTGSHCKGSSLNDLPDSWDLVTCAHECFNRPNCIGFTFDRTRNEAPFMCILKAKGCENIGPHPVWSFYRKLRQSSGGAGGSAASSYPGETQEHASQSVVEVTQLSNYHDTGEHCRGGAIDASYLEVPLEQCAKECNGNKECGGFTWDKTATSSGFKCITKLANCEMSGPHSTWTFYRKIDLNFASSSRSSEPDARSAGRSNQSGFGGGHPPASEESRRIFQTYFNGVDGNCEGTPIVSLPVPNKEACATECYNHPKCLGFSVQVGRDQPPLECQLNAQRCWHPRSDSSFRFFNREEDMGGVAAASGGQGGQTGFIAHDGMCLDQTGEFWVDSKSQCADRCLVDHNCQGYSFTANGNMCRLIFSFDCNGAMIFRRLADQFTTQRHDSYEEGGSRSGGQQQLAPRCYLPPDTGPCKANLRRWFYNSNQCEEFVFGGCEGNNNNFLSLDECEQHCAPIGPSSRQQQAESQQESEPSGNPSIIIHHPVGQGAGSETAANIIGYKSLGGNCPGHVLQEIFQPMKLEGCADRCNAAPTCAGFAYAQEDQKCVLKDGPCKNPNPHKFVYYTKL